MRLMPERQCHGCKRQKEWGCRAKRFRDLDEAGHDGPQNWIYPAHLATEFDDEQLWCCPRQTLFEQPKEWNRLLLLYGMYGKGHLPDSGAVIDQSNSLLQAFRLLDEANAECEEELAQQEKRRRNRQLGKPGRR